MNTNIIRAGAAHAPVLAALHEGGFAAPWRAEEFAALLQQPGVGAWMWLQNESALGFILLRAVADEAEVLTLAVLPAARRKGIGAALLRVAATQLAAGETKCLFLEVAADNAAALALYEGEGFKTTGRRKKYYARGADHVDAVTMIRVLA